MESSKSAQRGAPGTAAQQAAAAERTTRASQGGSARLEQRTWVVSNTQKVDAFIN